MAKKTNKTDHVLNLLAGGGETEEESVKKNKAEKNDLAGVNVQVIDQQEEGDDIANEVNRLLEEALEESEGLADGTSEPEEAVPAEPEQALAEEAKTGPTRETAGPESDKAEGDVSGGTEPKGPEEAASDTPQPEMKAAPEPEATDSKAEETPRPEEEKIKSVVVEESEFEMNDGDGEQDYVFVNVMGKLTRERVGEYMAEFGNCTCSRCIADTTALALIHLPPKYVVVSKNAETPLLNYYRQHYAAQITVEITKACTRVKQHPHHGRG